MLAKLLFLAIASESLYLFWALRSRLPVEQSLLAAWHRPALFEETLDFLAGWLVLFVLYALAVKAVSRTSRRSVTLLTLASAAAFRLTLAASDDAVAAGHALLEGGPLASALVASFSDVETRRVATMGLDLLALALAPGLLRAAGLPTGLALVQGWNPLLVKETALTPRLELVFAMAALLVAMRLVQRARETGAALVLGLGVGGWLGLAAALPAMVRAVGARVLVSLGVAGGLWWWASSGGAIWPETLAWPESRTGASLLPTLEVLSGLFVSRSPVVPLAAAASIWLLVALGSASRLRDDRGNLPAVVLPAVGFLVFLAPRVMPWGFLPFAYLGAHSRNRGWLAFTATAPLTYFALGTEEWTFWLGFTQYFVPYVSLTFVALGGKEAGDRG